VASFRRMRYDPAMKEKSDMRASEPEIELAPDAWERFERAVDVVAKSPPQRRVKRGTGTAARPPATKRGKRRKA
jgi:hypothetical protein